jgi:hypothetical protein
MICILSKMFFTSILIVARMGEMRKAYTVLFGKAESKRLFRRPSRRWENYIRMGVREVGWEGGMTYLVLN